MSSVKLIFFASVLLLFSCSSSTQKSVRVAMISGESLNVRFEGEPAPNEAEVALKCLDMEVRPKITYMSRNRALELFYKGKLDIVVAGQAANFPESLNSKCRIMGSTRAVILMDGNNKSFLEKDTLPDGSKVGFLRDSAFVTDFVNRAGDLQIKIFNGLQKAADAFKEGDVDFLVIDEIALDHIKNFLPEAVSRPIKAPARALYWLYR